MADHQANALNLSDEKNSNNANLDGSEISTDLDSIPNQIGNAILQVNGDSGSSITMSIVRHPTGSLSMADVKTLYNILLEIGTILSTDGRNVNSDIDNGSNGNMEEEGKEESKDVVVDANANADTGTSVGADLVEPEGREKKQNDENIDADINASANYQKEEYLKRVNVDVGKYSYSMCLTKSRLVYMVKKQNTVS